MGLDVQLYALVDPSPEEFEAAHAYFTAHCPSAMVDEYEHGCTLTYEGIERTVIDYGKPEVPQWPRVELLTLQRYADVYKTWPWPPIYQAIRLLQATFPNAVICYGSDSHWWCDPITEEKIEEIWAAWYLDQTKATSQASH